MNASNEFLEFLVDNIAPGKLAEFQSSDDARQRIWALIEKEKDPGLLPEETLELDDFLKLEHLLVLDKAKTRLATESGG